MKIIVLAVLMGLPLMAMGQTPVCKQQDPQVLAQPGGRFVLGQIGQARADQYLLDTKTGRVWRIVVAEDNQTMLQPVKFMTISGTATLDAPDADAEFREFEAKNSHMGTAPDPSARK